MGHRLLPHSPELYHGKESSRPYFEGWFFKQSSKDASLAIIPGVFRGRRSDGDTAFIQALLSNPMQSFFVRFPIESFSCDNRKFEIRIAGNRFSMDGVSLDIKDIDLRAEFSFSGVVPLKAGFLSPSIMGPFSYFPSMQCNHGILSLKHDVNGYASCGGRRIDFSDADGYIEKDWGEAFPKAWIWMQCGDKRSALVCSIAHIPYGPIRFTGLICALLAGGEQYRFATYNGAKLASLSKQGDNITLEIKRKDLRLKISAENRTYGSLKAPTPAGMDRVISESLSASYDIALYKRDEEIFAGSFENGGLEVYNSEEFIKKR